MYKVLNYLVPIKEQEVAPVLYSFASLFSVSFYRQGKKAVYNSTAAATHHTAQQPTDYVCVQILTSYFLLLPLREDAGISLGTKELVSASAASVLCSCP